MNRNTFVTIACALLMGCGDTTPTPSGDASVSDAPTLRDPAGTWTCDLLTWNPQTMMYGKSFGRETVVVARTATGISWHLTPGALTPDLTLDLVTRASGWGLAAPYMSPSAPDTGGRINSLDVSWRGDRLWGEEVGAASTIAGEREYRRGWDCVRAP